MIPVQRHERLLQLLRRDGVLSTRALTDALDVSHMTVRRDIAALEADGLVEAVAGGVRLVGTGAGVQPPRGRAQRAELELDRKQAIAAIGAGMVEDGATVYLDAGTTCQALVPLIARREGVTVVTNDFFSVIALLDHPHVETVHIGGRVDTDSGSSCGVLATRMLEAFHLDVFFLSTGAWSVARGVTAPTADKLDLKRAVMERSRATVLLADATKYGAAATYRVAGLDDLDSIVVDDRLDLGARDQLAALDVDVRLAATVPPA
ncbi:DeoR/GlpR family DNA-binding transcription regulator [Nocardioides sp. GY 10127]|uniref:DeoR/GlpR family DNA-binding transcription regulator n=1 Tax=Nocardioides sp. GY 10127 TaxID=2569762 RepID=UPI0010A7E68F|nr:DeoR/GlpR family DNA-binding transcription regulator [Nocardioides sp. GY 10127]TIC80273.1 DeoR/GlpR transcriptional regulator [Nocardioides sp. GY 10127]